MMTICPSFRFCLLIEFVIVVFLTGCGGGSSGANSEAGGALSLTGQITVEDSAPARAVVKDGPVSGATVQVLDAAGAVVAETITDENGNFAFHNLPPGTYSLVVTGSGFAAVTIDGVVVLSGDTAVVHGTVSSTGAEASVEYEVDDCTNVAQNSSQLAHAEALAQAAGVTADQVIGMREGCTGWGVIADQLNIPQSTLGLGHTRTHGGGRGHENGGEENQQENGNSGEEDQTGNSQGGNQGGGQGQGNGNNDNAHGNPHGGPPGQNN